MREVEFLPQWYYQLRRKKRQLRMQLVLTLVVFIALGLWSFLAARNVRIAEGALHLLRGQASQTQGELSRLAELEQLRQDWRQQDQIIARLGIGVETTRLIGTIEQLMPAEMALLDLAVDTREQPKQTDGYARLRAVLTDGQQIDRHLMLRMHGVAPSDRDLATFHTRLSEVPFFDNVAMSYARDRMNKGYLMREFEITFTMNINAAGVN